MLQQMPLVKLFWATGLLLVLSLRTACAVGADAVLIETHGEWNSRVVAPGTASVRFRAATTFQDATGPTVLTVDRRPANCNVQYLSLNVETSTAATTTIDLPAETGAMRIDEKPLHNIKYVMGLEKGNTTFFVTVMTWDRDETLIDEFTTGETIRFKLSQGNVNYFLHFPLNGFRAAQARTKELCEALKRSDSDFFDKKPGQTVTPKKSDKSYFPL